MSSELHEKIKEWAIYANFIMLLGAFLTFVFNFYALPGKINALENKNLKISTELAERAERFSTIEKDINGIQIDIKHNARGIARIEKAQEKFHEDFRNWAINGAR